MKQIISKEGLQKQVDRHRFGKSDGSSYGVNGAKWTKGVARTAEMLGAKSVLDFGCGKGMLATDLIVTTDLKVSAYDPAVPQYAFLPPEQVDLVVAANVLQEVEQEFMQNVIDTLYEHARLGILVMQKRDAEAWMNLMLLNRDEEWEGQRFAAERFKKGILDPTYDVKDERLVALFTRKQ